MRANNSDSARFGWAVLCQRALRELPCLAFFVIVLCAPAANAELGGSVSSIQADQQRMKGTLRITPTALFTVHEIQTSTGTVVREFVSSGGAVFGVAWEGPWMPDLRQLLGPYFDQFVKAAQERKPRGRGPLFIQTNGLVVHTGGHARSFFGKAYLVPMMPQNVSAEDIK